MALPSGGAWPPKNLEPIYDLYSILDAWYSGDRDRLATIYESANPTSNRPPNRPSQFRGGVVGRMARWFWGQPTPSGEPRTKLHVPVASDIATMSADLLFSEPPSITVQDPETQARIEELVENGIHTTLLEGAEVGAALGDYYLRTVWDEEIAPTPWLAVVHADAAVPEWRWGRLAAVTFWRVIEEDDRGTRLIHLERHEPGVILHGLYKGANGMLGEPLPLTAHAETAHLPPVIETGLTRCTAVHVPNMRPNREWRTNPVGVGLGRSDFAGPVLGLMDALDEVWTSWMRDIRLAKARLVVPSGYLIDNGPGKGASFDLDRELYEEVSSLGGNERMEISAHQFAIRVAEHRDTSAELLAAILRATGYSAQSFGLSGEVAITATEVMAKERRSLVTRGKKALYTRNPLADGIETLLQLEAAMFGTGVTPERPTIEFGDSVAADLGQLAQTAVLMRQAEAASDETIVRLLHPDWSDTEVQEEVARISDSRPAVVADPFALRPDDDGQDEDGVEPPAGG